MKFTSPIISEASGSWGGLTISHNRNGLYVRSRTNPVQPNTSRQVAARLLFQSIANAWSAVLTEAQRTGWILYGASVAWQPPFGNAVFLTGYNMYLRTNMAALTAGLDRVDEPPTIFTLAETDPTFLATASEATQELSVTFDPDLDWAKETGGAMLIYQSQPRGAGRNFINGPYRYASVILGDDTTPPTSPATIAAPFAIAETQKTEVLGRIVRLDGRLSNWFRVILAVGA